MRQHPICPLLLHIDFSPIHPSLPCCLPPPLAAGVLCVWSVSLSLSPILSLSEGPQSALPTQERQLRWVHLGSVCWALPSYAYSTIGDMVEKKRSANINHKGETRGAAAADWNRSGN
ncbi:unnamed protein product [Calypogeia fissa]